MPSKPSTRESRFFLDTNFFIRYFLDDIPEQTEIIEKVLRDGQEKTVNLFVSLDTIIDINNVLEYSYSITKDERLQILKQLKNMMFLKYPSKEIKNQTYKAIEVYSRFSLDFQDCVALAACSVHNYTLFSYEPTAP